jgi:hypothetical protein
VRVLGGKKVRNWLKLAFVALLVATIVLGITLCLVLKEYYDWEEGMSDIDRLWGDARSPWWLQDGNSWVLYVGIGLLLAWTLLVASYSCSRRESKAEKLEPTSKKWTALASWPRVLLYLLLIVGCGSILTLASCSYVRGLNEDLLYWMDDVEHKALMFGFPAPVFHSYVIGTALVAEFRWEGALIDVALYSVIVGAVFPFLWIIRLFRKS